MQHFIPARTVQTHLNPNRERTLHDGAYLFPTDGNLGLREPAKAIIHGSPWSKVSHSGVSHLDAAIFPGLF